MNENVHLIKKYANRKLYDTKLKKYVTLKYISQLVKNGKEVKVIDNVTGNDITATTLAQIIAKLESKDSSKTPLLGLKFFIQKRSDWLKEYFDKSFLSGKQTIEHLISSIQSFFKSLLQKGIITPDDVLKIINSIKTEFETKSSKIEEVIDKKIYHTLYMMCVPSLKEINQLNDRIDKLVEKINSLIKKLENEKEE